MNKAAQACRSDFFVRHLSGRGTSEDDVLRTSARESRPRASLVPKAVMRTRIVAYLANLDSPACANPMDLHGQWQALDERAHSPKEQTSPRPLVS